MKLCLALLVALCAASPGHARVLCDLGDAQTTIFLHRADKNRQNSVRVPALDGRPALRFNWDSGLDRYFEFALKNAIRLPSFDSAVIRVAVYVPKGCRARDLCVRLRDAEGETFQYRAKLAGGNPGWREIEFKVDASAAPNGGTWGGGKNASHKIVFPVNFTGMASNFENNTGEGWLGFGEVSFAVTSAAPALTLETGKGSPVHVLMPGDEALLGLRVVNQRPDARELAFEYTLTDAFEGVVQKRAVQFMLASGAEKFLPLPPPKAFGTYALDTRLSESIGGAPRKGIEFSPPVARRLSYAYMRPAGPSPGAAKGFLFGLSLHTQRFGPDDQRREAFAAGLCGAKIYREDISWNRVENRLGVWDWSRYDNLIALYAAQHMEMQGIFNGGIPPQYGRQMRAGDAPPAAWGEFVRRFAERYRGRVRYMEVWNEPDHSAFLNTRPDFYLKMLKTAYREAKAADPGMTMLTGGIAGMTPKPQAMAFIRAELSQGKGFYDVIAAHMHGSFAGYVPQVRVMEALRKEFGITAPWYANETAQPTNWASAAHGSAQVGQGETLFKKLLWSWSEGAIGYNWYDLRDDGFDPNDAEENYGLLTHDFYPKAVYVVYDMLSGYFREATFLRAFDLDADLHAFLFRGRGADFLLPAWSDDSSDRLFDVAGVTGKASLVDMFGNETPLPVVNGSVAFQIGSTPATLRITGQAEPPAMRGEFVSCDEDFNIAAGGTSAFRVRLHNPTGEALTFSVGVTPPDGIAGENARKDIAVAPGRTVGFASVLRAAGGFYSLPENPKCIRLALKVDASSGHTLWSGVVSREIHTLTTISEKGFDRAPDFNLNDLSQVTRLVASAADNERFYWKGPKDLGARVWPGRSGRNLLVKTVVTDDVHHEPYRGGQLWQGDSVQIALQLPGQSGLWEIDLGRHNDGIGEVFTGLAPAGFDAAKTTAAINLATSRDETAGITTYVATIPLAAIGLTDAIGGRGFRFDLLVNDDDNDGGERKNYITIAPGIGDEKSPRRYPVLSFR